MSATEIIQVFPSPNSTKGRILSDIDKDACERAVEELFESGAPAVRELVALLVEPGGGDDVRPRHALNAMAIRCGGPNHAARREAFANTLAGTLDDDLPLAVKGFVIRQLQLCAGPRQAPAIAPFLIIGDEHIYEYAAQALEAIGADTAPHFRDALPNAMGAPRLTILQGLGVLADADSAAAFRTAAANADLETRLAGLWGLMRIADATTSADLLLDTADKESGWGRIKSTGYCLQLAENLAASGNKTDARKIYQHLLDTRTARSESHIRNAATIGLKKLNA